MLCFLFFFFNDTATTEIYTLSLHDALPICFKVLSTSKHPRSTLSTLSTGKTPARSCARDVRPAPCARSEEHTSELQSRLHLVCRLLLEKKKKKKQNIYQETNTTTPQK